MVPSVSSKMSFIRFLCESLEQNIKFSNPDLWLSFKSLTNLSNCLFMDGCGLCFRIIFLLNSTLSELLTSNKDLLFNSSTKLSGVKNKVSGGYWTVVLSSSNFFCAFLNKSSSLTKQRSSWLITIANSFERDSIIDFLFSVNDIFEVLGKRFMLERGLMESCVLTSKLLRLSIS